MVARAAEGEGPAAARLTDCAANNLTSLTIVTHINWSALYSLVWSLLKPPTINVIALIETVPDPSLRLLSLWENQLAWFGKALYGLVWSL